MKKHLVLFIATVLVIVTVSVVFAFNSKDRVSVRPVSVAESFDTYGLSSKEINKKINSTLTMMNDDGYRLVSTSSVRHRPAPNMEEYDIIYLFFEK